MPISPHRGQRYICFFSNSPPDAREVAFHCGFVCSSLVAEDAEHLFVCLWAFCRSSLQNVYAGPRPVCEAIEFLLLLLNCRSSLYIPDRNPISEIWPAKMGSRSVGFRSLDRVLRCTNFLSNMSTFLDFSSHFVAPVVQQPSNVAFPMRGLPIRVTKHCLWSFMKISSNMVLVTRRPLTGNSWGELERLLFITVPNCPGLNFFQNHIKPTFGKRWGQLCWNAFRVSPMA